MEIREYQNLIRKDRVSVDLTLHNIPSDLIRDFNHNVMKPYYEGRIGHAIKDLMRKAIEEQKQKQKKT